MQVEAVSTPSKYQTCWMLLLLHEAIPASCFTQLEAAPAPSEYQGSQMLLPGAVCTTSDTWRGQGTTFSSAKQLSWSCIVLLWNVSSSPLPLPLLFKSGEEVRRQPRTPQGRKSIATFRVSNFYIWPDLHMQQDEEVLEWTVSFQVQLEDIFDWPPMRSSPCKQKISTGGWASPFLLELLFFFLLDSGCLHAESIQKCHLPHL